MELLKRDSRWVFENPCEYDNLRGFLRVMLGWTVMEASPYGVPKSLVGRARTGRRGHSIPGTFPMGSERI
jgi:hypothetical protein